MASVEVTLRQRHVVRLAHGFALEGFHAIRDAVGLELRPCLVFVAINLANNRQRIEPGHLRRPVSVYALNKQLGVPYETVRRYVGILSDAGFCRRLADDGLIVSMRGPRAESVRAGAHEALRSTQKYVAAMSNIGVEAAQAAGPLTEAHLEAVSLLATEHFLNLLGLATEAFEIEAQAAFVQMAILHANTRAMVLNPAKAHLVGLDAVPTDEERKPVSVYRVAKSLGLPYETVRRQVVQLQAAGLCRRLESGAVMIPSEVLARPRFMAATAAVVVEVERYLSAVSELAASA